MENEDQKTLEPEILDSIQSFSGSPGEMSAGEKILSEGKSLQRTQTAYTTAIAVQKPRSITRVAHNVLEESKLAGASFYYGWSVKTKNGPVKIEGPSIDLAMCVARNYGNCVIDVEGTETLTHYMLKGVFIDLESGFTCPRLFRQRKRQSIGGKMEKDLERQEDIVFQIGQSKAIRNAVVRAMPEWLISQAIETAKSAERSKIENINIAREKVISFFKPYGITIERIESKIDRIVDQWTEDDIVDLRGMATALKEGRITADELFPKTEQPTDEKSEEIQGQTKPELFQCPYCSFNTESERGLKKHITQQHKDNTEDKGEDEGKGQGEENHQKSAWADDDFWRRQIMPWQEDLGLPTFNRILSRFDAKTIEEVPADKREECWKAMSLEADNQAQ